MLQTISSTEGRTILDAPDDLRQLKGYMLAHEDQAALQTGDLSAFHAMRKALDYAIHLTEEARSHYRGDRESTWSPSNA